MPSPYPLDPLAHPTGPQRPTGRLAGLWESRKPELICGALCLLVLIAAGRILFRRQLYIETENATLQGYAIALSAEVEGEVLRVFVEENQPVRKGQLLCTLDDRRYRARYSEAVGKRNAIRAQWEMAERDQRRAAQLLRRRAVSASVRDQAQAQADSLLRRLQAAQSDAVLAETGFQRTRVRAPADGVIAFRTARPGMLAQKGFPLFGFVDRAVSASDRWVVAKVRETDLPDLHVGKPVQVRFDAAPGREFAGKIESISPATEHPFYAAIPADFSAGNFTKYVQWHPIRVRLALSREDEARLPVGASSSIHMARD